MAKVFVHYVDLMNIQVIHIHFQGGDSNENC